jgi:competence CoiA-like predicted nuclease
MALALQCKFFGHIIDIDKALAVREAAVPEHRNYLLFECPKCGNPVRPRMAGDKHVAHFVHISENPQCRLTDPPSEYLD